MTYTIERETDQQFIQADVSWAQFQAIQAGFADSPGVRLFYYRRELEILGVGFTHEFYRALLAALLTEFFVEMSVDVTPAGCFTVQREGEVSIQADESYFIGPKGDRSIPDLAVEIVITSGGPQKLERYRALGVTEVWFWQNQRFTLYRLEGGNYQEATTSGLLRELNIELLTRCMVQPSLVEAVKEFRKGMRQTWTSSDSN
jgi:Uma2 family endonuclease